MTALDTNILIRFLVRDDEKQAQAVFKKLKNAEDRRETLFVPLAVVLEMMWVLDSVYSMSRSEILDAFDSLKSMPILKFEKEHVIQTMVAEGMNTAIELPDLLIALSAKSNGCDSMFTFDRKALKYPFFKLLS